MHLAQLNVGRLRAPMDDPQIDDFRENLDPINALAEGSPGFVWRLQDESGNATGIKPYGDDLEIVNLTVWESVEALADFTYRTGHVELLRRRREFFEAASAPILCLWWIPEGPSPRWRTPSPASTTSGRSGPPPPRSPSRSGSSLTARRAPGGAPGTPARPEPARARGRTRP